MKKIQNVIERDGNEIAGQAEKLRHILICLRFEGKPHLGKNIKAIKDRVALLDQALKKHQKYQEKILFPFLKAHLPSYESTIHFLESDHQAMRENARKMRRSLKFSQKPDCFKANLQKAGLCLVYLLRHHIQLEQKSIQKAFQKNLNDHERKRINIKIKKCFQSVYPSEAYEKRRH